MRLKGDRARQAGPSGEGCRSTALWARISSTVAKARVPVRGACHDARCEQIGWSPSNAWHLCCVRVCSDSEAGQEVVCAYCLGHATYKGCCTDLIGCSACLGSYEAAATVPVFVLAVVAGVRPMRRLKTISVMCCLHPNVFSTCMLYVSAPPRSARTTVPYRTYGPATSCAAKKMEIRWFFVKSRSNLDLASAVHRLHFGAIFRNYTCYCTRTDCDSKKSQISGVIR